MFASWGTSAALLHLADERRMWLRYLLAGVSGYVFLVLMLTVLFGRIWKAGAAEPSTKLGGSWDVPDIGDALTVFDDPIGCLVIVLGLGAMLVGVLLFNAVGGLVELGLETAVVGATVRRLRSYHSTDWGLGLRRTALPALLLIAAGAGLGAILQSRNPQVSTMREWIEAFF